MEEGHAHGSPQDRTMLGSRSGPAGGITDGGSDREISGSPVSRTQQPYPHSGQLPTPTRSVSGLSHLSLHDAFSLMNEAEAHLFRHYVQKLAVCVSIVTI